MLCMVFPYINMNCQLLKSVKAYPGLYIERLVRDDNAAKRNKVKVSLVAAQV